MKEVKRQEAADDRQDHQPDRLALKGLRESTVIVKHATPNALHTIVAYQGTVLPYMMQGELEAAIVLGLPTMGPLFYESLVNQDIYISGSLLLMYGMLI